MELRKNEEQLIVIPVKFLNGCSYYTYTTLFFNQNLQNLINLELILLFSIKKYEENRTVIERYDAIFYAYKQHWINFGTNTLWNFLFKKTNPEMSQEFLKKFTIKRVTKKAKKDLWDKIETLKLSKRLTHQKKDLYNFILELAKEIYIARELLWLDE